VKNAEAKIAEAVKRAKAEGKHDLYKLAVTGVSGAQDFTSLQPPTLQ
jgi:hypothetical protein